MQNLTRHNSQEDWGRKEERSLEWEEGKLMERKSAEKGEARSEEKKRDLF